MNNMATFFNKNQSFKKNTMKFIIIITLLGITNPLLSQTITSLSRVTSPSLPNSGLIVNGGFETGAPPVNTWYQWAKNNTCPAATYAPAGWTVTSATNNNGPKRYATWGRLVVGGGIYPFTNNTQQWVYEVYTSTNPSRCFTDLTNATASDPGSFPLGVASADGNNYLYFGNGTGNITGFPTPLASWVSSTSSPNNLRVYADNSSLGTLSGPLPVTLSQTVSTVNGSNYILEFWVSGEELSVGTQKDGFFVLEIGTQKLYLAVPGSKNDHGLGSHFYYQVQFTAASTSTLIRFTNYCHVTGGNWSGYLAGAPASELLLDDVRLNLTSVLPVHLISFDGNKNTNKINLSWKVDNEANFSHYEVERSFNLSTPFVKISKVNANTTFSGVYNFIDDLNTFQQNEKVYYRLKMVDIDGKYTYSNVIQISLNGNSSLQIATNPVIEDLKISGLNGSGQITIYDLSGKVIVQKSVQSKAMTFDISFLNSGMYILKYFDGIKIQTQKFSKL